MNSQHVRRSCGCGGLRRCWHETACGFAAGFSLVEVVLALGVAAFAIIGIFALTQTGLVSFRDSQNESVGVSIGQQVLAQYMLARYDVLATSGPVTNYYDVRGLDTSSDSTNAIYRSVSGISAATGLSSTTNNLLRLQVEITSPTQPYWKKSFISFIARQGEDLP